METLDGNVYHKIIEIGLFRKNRRLMTDKDSTHEISVTYERKRLVFHFRKTRQDLMGYLRDFG